MTPTNTTPANSATLATSARDESVSSEYQGLSNLANTLFNWLNTVFTQRTPESSSLDGKCQFPINTLPTDLIHLIFMQFLSTGDIKDFKALGCTNMHLNNMIRKFVNGTALTKLCPNLRILDAKAFKFQADLINVDKYKTLQSYYKLEPFVENHEGLTIIFNQGGLTLNGMKENNCEISVKNSWSRISTKLGNIPEKDEGPEMISNAPITETLGKSPEILETLVRQVGFDGKPTLIQSLALLIATQKELKICLYGNAPKRTYGYTSTNVDRTTLAVGGSDLGCVWVSHDPDLNYKSYGAGGRLKLQAIGP